MKALQVKNSFSSICIFVIKKILVELFVDSPGVLHISCSEFTICFSLNIRQAILCLIR